MSLRLEARSRRRAAVPPVAAPCARMKVDDVGIDFDYSRRALHMDDITSITAGTKDKQRAVTSSRRPVCRPPLCKCAAIGRGRRAPPLVCIHRLITLARTSSARRSFLTIKLLGAPFPR
ncbi:hypothetical protein EVAR_43483_1 [Eumeta japonica]|uniref:Uncharacterized protein n=1 Tax=Eumeta variegata TaxID=151549 RepID=A0A4C1YMI3_EUMVA|nr:hypothetical protein EVAR_43483_1 [Eumeta japonica]